MSAQRPRLKLGRCIKELERIYGIRDGSTNSKGVGVSEKFSFTQKDLSDELGIDVRTMQNYKKLTKLLEEMVHSKKVYINTYYTFGCAGRTAVPKNIVILQ